MGRRASTAVASSAHRVSGDAPTSAVLAEVEEEHVRRRVDRPQRAVDGHRGGARSGAGGARDDDLEHVAGDDVLLRDAHAVAVLVGVELGGEAVAPASAETGIASSGTGPSRRRAISSASSSWPGCAITWTVRRTWSKATTTRHEQEAGGRRDVAVAALGQATVGSKRRMASYPEVADDAADERRQPLQVELPGAVEERAGAGEQVALRRGVEEDRLAAGGQERVAPDLLAALDRLQQEARARGRARAGRRRPASAGRRGARARSAGRGAGRGVWEVREGVARGRSSGRVGSCTRARRRAPHTREWEADESSVVERSRYEPTPTPRPQGHRHQEEVWARRVMATSVPGRGGGVNRGAAWCAATAGSARPFVGRGACWGKRRMTGAPSGVRGRGGGPDPNAASPASPFRRTAGGVAATSSHDTRRCDRARPKSVATAIESRQLVREPQAAAGRTSSAGSAASSDSAGSGASWAFGRRSPRP